MRTTHSAFIVLLLSTTAWLLTTPHLAANTPPAAPDELLRNATLVIRRALDTSSAAIPASIMARARGLAVFPAARTDGGMYYGLGVMSARGANPLRWTPPAVLNFRGAIPIDLDAASVDFVFVALTSRGLDYITDQMLPVPMRIHPGPLGQDTREQMAADVVGYLEFGDYFAGVSVENWTIVGMSSANQQLYGRPYSTDEMVRGAGFFNPPPASRAWLEALADYFHETS